MSMPSGTVRAFAYMTNDGELILLDELVREMHAGLSARGFQLDPLPLKTMVQSFRAVVEHLSASHAGHLPDPDALCAMVALELRSRRMIIGAPVVRAMLEEYLRQLKRLDIGRITDY